jgi:hypothetical protein
LALLEVFLGIRRMLPLWLAAFRTPHLDQGEQYGMDK